MARKVTWGTPRRSDHYLFPRPKLAFVRPALLLGFGLLALLVILWAIGVRRPIAPGAVISSHGMVETSCQACHATAQGVANIRCQRCHDPATAGRLDNRSHVLFGSGDMKKAQAAPPLECATCHVEHRGRGARLAVVDQRQCSSCHFRGFSGHPEFAVLRTPSRELPGMIFGHGSAVASFKGHVAEVMQKKGLPETAACLTCHEPLGRDFQPISYDRHCAECHKGALSSTDAVPIEDVLAPGVFIGGGFSTQPVTTAEFDEGRDGVAKTTLRHKDDWVLASARRLRRELEPGVHANERAALQARLSRLRRRYALSKPLVELDEEELAEREELMKLELDGIEKRLQAMAQAKAPTGSRLDEVAGALLGPGVSDETLRAEAEKLKAEAATAKPMPVAAAEFDVRRKQVLALLDAVEAADPTLKPRAEELRRRILTVAPGDSSQELLERARSQRQEELARIRDERVLLASKVAPRASALLLGEQRALETAILDLEAQLKRLDEGPPVAETLTDEVRARKKESLQTLTASCVKCHVMAGATLSKVRAARPVLVRAGFVHQPHLLQTDCRLCHEGVEVSKAASDLNFKGIQSCRECHSTGAARQDCLSCHRYHPPALP